MTRTRSARSSRSESMMGSQEPSVRIAPEYEESAARQLSRELDLTIIQVNQGDGKEYMATEGYSVIPVDAETYQKKAYNIVI